MHLKAPAGGGKTYVGLHRMLEQLTAGNQKARFCGEEFALVTSSARGSASASLMTQCGALRYYLAFISLRAV